MEKPQVLLFSEEVKQTNENNTGDKHTEWPKQQQQQKTKQEQKQNRILRMYV